MRGCPRKLKMCTPWFFTIIFAEPQSGNINPIDVYVGTPAFSNSDASSLAFCDHIPGFSVASLDTKTAHCYLPVYADYIYIEAHNPIERRISVCDIAITLAGETLPCQHVIACQNRC